MNITKEDYLKLIYQLSGENNSEYIKPKEIATRFNYTDQSVNEMIKKLQESGYLEFIPYKGVVLTKQGLDEALRITKIHRIWEVFLVEKLGLSWKDVHDEAELLEHATTEKVASALYKYLGEPKYCTHGSPIPNRDNELPKLIKTSLADVSQGSKFKLKRVIDDQQLLNYLEVNNLEIDSVLKIIKVDTFSDLIEVEVNNKILNITTKVAEMIFGNII